MVVGVGGGHMKDHVWRFNHKTNVPGEQKYAQNKTRNNYPVISEFCPQMHDAGS